MTEPERAALWRRSVFDGEERRWELPGKRSDEFLCPGGGIMDALKLRPGLGNRGAVLFREMKDRLCATAACFRSCGEDMPEIRDRQREEG